jgi:thiosulfate reductase cytochrome b subunit
VHLLAGAVLAAYVYAPLGTELEDLVRFAVFPMLVLTGIAMWQAARIRRALRSLRARREAKA